MNCDKSKEPQQLTIQLLRFFRSTPVYSIWYGRSSICWKQIRIAGHHPPQTERTSV